MPFCDDIEVEHARLTGLGVTFRSGVTKGDGFSNAVFQDTCGNLIMLAQMKPANWPRPISLCAR